MGTAMWFQKNKKFIESGRLYEDNNKNKVSE
jgi:hypothetical protein